MATFSLLLVVTVALQPQWAVAPTYGTSGGEKTQSHGRIPGTSAPPSGSFNTNGRNIGMGLMGMSNSDNIGPTYRVKSQRNVVNGDCNEHWEIGLSRLERMWKPAFYVKCKGRESRKRINGPGILLVSNPDDSFCFFSNNPSFLTVIKNGACIRYEYESNGNKKSEKVLDKSNCDEEKKTMRDLIKAEEEKTSVNVFTNINSGVLGSEPLNAVTSETKNGILTKTGPHYTVEQNNMINGGKLEKKIRIIRRVDDKLLEEFIVPCTSTGLIMGILVEGEEALVGEPDGKFFVFTMTKTRDSLIVFQDGKCKKKTYSEPKVYELTYKDNDCKNIKESITKIHGYMKSRQFKTRNGIIKANADIDALEEELVKQLTEITPESKSSYKIPATKTTSPPNMKTSMNSKDDKPRETNKKFGDAVAGRGRATPVKGGGVKTTPPGSAGSSKVIVATSNNPKPSAQFNPMPPGLIKWVISLIPEEYRTKTYPSSP